MISSEVERTLVKSPPELWTELSDPAALARHLGEFGEIRITRVEPEQRVEWEAENATGSVMIKPSGWGTKVTLSVTKEASEPDAQQSAEPEPTPDAPPEPEAQQAPEPETVAVAEPEPASDPEPEPAPEPEQTLAPEPRLGFFARLFGRRRRERAPEPAALRTMASAEDSPGQPGDAFAAVSQVLAPETFAAGRTTFTPWPEPAPQAAPAADTAAEAPADTPAEAPADTPAEAPAPTGATSTPEDPAPSEAPAATADIAAEIRAAEEVAAAEVTAMLTSVLDRLGAAHHRPFSRS
jgi:hypothetical protein